VFVQAGKPDKILKDWLSQNSSTVDVERRDPIYDPLFDPNTTPPSQYSDPGAHGMLVETYYIFKVLAPTRWPVGVGFPNTAGPGVKGPADVKNRPPPVTAPQVARELADEASDEWGKLWRFDIVPVFWIGLGIYILGRSQKWWRV
jgi:hypothetical protein